MGYKYRDTKAISIDPVTETGNIVTFENPDDVTGITSLIADITPKQDGTPWVSPDNTAPYLLRQSPQYGNEYNNEVDTLIGGSIAWNQLVGTSFNGLGTTAGTTFTLNTSGTVHVTGTGTGNHFCEYRTNEHSDFKLIDGHSYAVSIKGVTSGMIAQLLISGSSTIYPISAGVSVETIYKYSARSGDTGVNIRFYTTSSYSGTTDVSLNLIDLTATFGTEIADYVYSLEQSTAGSGIAWLKSYGFLTKDYYAYNDGSLVSVKTSEHRTTGFNQWDEEVALGYFDAPGTWYSGSWVSSKYAIPVLPNTTYYLNTSGERMWVTFWKENVPSGTTNTTDFISRSTDITNGTITTPSNCRYIHFNLAGAYGTTYKNDICINISKTTGTPKNGDYVAYESHSYPLDSDLELRGIPKLSNGSLYYDGDEYRSDGTVNRLYRRYTSSTTHTDEYGTLGSGIPYYGIILSNDSDKIVNGNTKDIVCNLGYIALRAGEASASGGFRAYDENEFIFYDTRFTSIAVAQQLLADLEIVYKAKTSTTETADSFASPQIVSPLGTEEYVDTRDVPVPVGHRTVYKNIAPISGYSEINIYVSPTEDAEDATVYPVDLNGTRYGKQMNVTTGQLEVCPYYASYNGETLTGEWISDRDVYAPGTTPSIGAQVVNIGGTLTTEQLLPTDIKTLVGTNNVWSDSGDITLTYVVDPSLYITLPKEAVSMDGRYLERMIDGYTTLYVKGRESLGIELNNYSVGTADGEKIKGSRYPSRTLTIGFQLLCEDEVEFRAKFNQLNNILSIDEADFIFADEPTMFFTGTPIMDASIEPGRNNVVGEWKLYCAYPFKRSVAPIVHASTDADVVKAGNTATFTFDYAGTRPARPLLRATFASAKSGGDYNEDGDCGYIAFLDSEENIIQLGNPDVIDVDALNKNGTLINSEFDNLTNWTASGISVGSIVDAFWDNGKGQTQNYATGIGTLARTATGAIGFEFDIVHRLCVSAPAQTGTFKVSLKNGNNVIVGFIIEKTGSGTLGTVKYILNNKVVGTDSIDLSFYNTNFGYCRRDPVYVTQYYQEKEYYYVKKKGKKKKKSRWVTRTRTVQSGWSYTQSNLNSGISRDGGIVTFSVGNLADRTFKDSDIDNTSCTSVVFETTGTFHTNAVRSCAWVRKAGVPFAEIPNVFTAGDIVEGDCNTANVLLYRAGSAEGHLEPQYGALGNDWEDFTIKPGQNIIRAVWSDWVNENYKPKVEIIFNEVFI